MARISHERPEVRRNIAITATLQRERQQSSDPLAHFEARVALIGVSTRF